MKRNAGVEELYAVLNDFFLMRGTRFEETCQEISRRVVQLNVIYIFGNGGSAAQAQHFAAEIVGRFMQERKALPAVALTTDTSVLTAVSNDEDFSAVFKRQIEAFGRSGDVAIGLSTSGNSSNVIEALKEARRREMWTVAFTGRGGGRMKNIPHQLLDVPSDRIPRIQETHLFLLHALAEAIESRT